MRTSAADSQRIMSAEDSLPADEVLVARLRHGDEAAFALLLDSWSGGMRRVAASYVATRASADEVVQDTWLAVIEHIDSFEGRSSLKHWVYRIVANSAKRRGRREHRTIPSGGFVPGDEVTVAPARFVPGGQPYAGHWHELPSPWPSPEQETLAAEMSRLVAEAVCRLPARQGAVITLRDIEGHTSQETCSLLDISPANQRVLLHRARAGVRAELENYLSPGA